MRAAVQITLGKTELEALIRGAEVHIWRKGVLVRMILSDIGFEVIEGLVQEAREGEDWIRQVKEFKQ